MKNIVLTIGREYGSGGRYIGEMVSKKLNIPFYDRVLIEKDLLRNVRIKVLPTGGWTNTITMAYDVAMYHHEKWNGKGYPKGLKGEEIPLSARIVAVADVFDAVSAKRCYRDALSLDECFRIIQDGRGTDFDPEVVDAFLADQDKVKEICRKNA